MKYHSHNISNWSKGRVSTLNQQDLCGTQKKLSEREKYQQSPCKRSTSAWL